MVPDIFPNCLLKSKKVDVAMSRNGQEWLYLFCANCGCDGGRVLKTNIPNREEVGGYLCDQCVEKYGEIAGLMLVPDEVFWSRVNEIQLAEFGRVLTQPEIEAALAQENHILSKLAREKRS